uniref:Secreted protein n=1 Tax=Panagrellus redivivus TaxID=6233 RepID=A0A7E4W0L8_PANRE
MKPMAMAIIQARATLPLMYLATGAMSMATQNPHERAATTKPRMNGSSAGADERKGRGMTQALTAIWAVNTMPKPETTPNIVQMAATTIGKSDGGDWIDPRQNARTRDRCEGYFTPDVLKKRAKPSTLQSSEDSNSEGRMMNTTTMKTTNQPQAVMMSPLMTPGCHQRCQQRRRNNTKDASECTRCDEQKRNGPTSRIRHANKMQTRRRRHRLSLRCRDGWEMNVKAVIYTENDSNHGGMTTEGSEDETHNDQEAETDVWNRTDDANDAKDAGIDTSEEKDADISKIEAEMR